MKHWNEMTAEEQRQYSEMIDAYLPHRRDESLGWDEYYVIGSNDGRCYRVTALDVLPSEHSETYGCYTSNKLKWVDAGYGDRFHGFTKASMYDNKQDCLDATHCVYDRWEMLRELQKERDNDN